MRILSTLFLASMIATGAHAADRKPPYWASIDAGEARMRTGPGLTYPVTWLYRRPDLPIRVVETYPNWRKVQEPDGTTGWMLVSLLQDTRTAIIPQGTVRTLRVKPSDDAGVAFRAGPGVVGLVSKCGGGWCRFDVKGRSGFIRTAEIWGVDPDEVLD